MVQLLKSGFMSLDQVATAFMESPEMKPIMSGPPDGLFDVVPFP